MKPFNTVLADVKSNVRSSVSKSHPAALLAWAMVAVLLVGAVAFTWYHNYRLFARGLPEGMTWLAFAPPSLMDGSILLILVLYLFWMRDGMQKLVALGFNLLLFVFVAVGTIIDYNLSTGEQISGGLRTWLTVGLVASFLITLAGWEIIIHLDPANRQRAKRGALELEAEEAAFNLEMENMRFQVEQAQSELEFQRKLHAQMHARRMKAVEGEQVSSALEDFERSEGAVRAKEIRGAHSADRADGNSKQTVVWRGHTRVDELGN
jgi:hypothetical protein